MDRPPEQIPAEPLEPAGESGDKPGDMPGEVPEEVSIDGQSAFQMDTCIQAQLGADAIGQLEEIKPENWAQLEAGERLAVLQNIEGTMAAIQHRPEVPVISERLGPGEFGCFDGQCIQVSANDLAGGELPVSEFVDTVVHEGRHAFQQFAVEHSGTAGDTQVEADWVDNFAHYLSANEYGQELYQSQPVEADAWSFANQVCQGLR